MTDRVRYGLFATILGVIGVGLSLLGFLAARNPDAARLVGFSDGVATLVTGLSFTAIACAVVWHYGRRSAQLATAYQDLHRATLQRERSEAALRESERFTRATLDAMDAQIAVLDADGVVMAVNRAWRAEPHPLLCDAGACDVGSNYLTLCGTVTDGRAVEAARVATAIRAITAGERDDCLLEGRLDVGGRLLVTRVTRFAGNGPLRLVVAHQDVTALAYAPQETRPASPAELPADAFPVGLFRADASGGLTSANAHLLALVGADLEGALGSGWLQMVHPDDRAAAVAQWQRLTDARASGEVSFRVLAPDGAVRACVLRATAVDGDVPGFVGTVIDVVPDVAAPEPERRDEAHAIDLARRVDDLLRERDRAGSALRAAEAERTRTAEELARLYDDSPCGYHALDADGLIVAANETLCAWLGHRRSKLVGERRFADLLTPATAARFADALRALEDGRTPELDVDVPRKDGSVVTLWVRLSAVHDGAGYVAGSRATLLDVTASRQAAARIAALEQALAARDAALEDASRRLDEATARLDDADVQLDEARGRLHDTTQRLDETSRQLAEATRELEPFARSRGAVDMAALARDVVDEVRARHPSRDVLVTIDGLAPAHGDAPLLRELLAQLLDHAFKQTAAVPHPYVDLGSVDAEGGPVYYVRDNGAGFDPRRAASLFDAGADANGIGLALVQRVVEQHGGRLWAEGRIDDGATFFFTLGEAPTDASTPRLPLGRA